MKDPPEMGSQDLNQTEGSLTLRGENKKSVHSRDEGFSSSQRESDLRDSRWALSGTPTKGKRRTTSTRSDPGAASDTESIDTFAPVPRFVVDPVLAKIWREKRDEEKAQVARQLAAFEEFKTSFATPAADHQTSFCTSTDPAPYTANPKDVSEWVFDEDGDVIMVDLEKWEDINEVAHVVAEDRVSERAVRRRPEGLAPGHRVSDATHVLVVDTSFLLAHVGLVNDLVLSYRDWGCVVVIPWATIEELDGLKKSPRFVNPGNTHGYPGSMRDYHGRIDISVLARGANRWAFEVLSKPEPGVWGQTKEEVFEGTFNQGDMAILDCARYFYDQGYSTCLLTNDFNLSVKALVYKIKAFMYERGQTWKTLLTKIYGASERLRHLPQSKELSTQPTGSKVEQRQVRPVEQRVEQNAKQIVDSGYEERLVNRVESRTERKAEQIADSEIVRDAERNAVAGVLPHNPMRGSYIAPMVTRPYRESRNNVSSNRHRSSSPLNDQVQQRPVEGMEKSMYVPRNRIRETSETNSAVGHVHPIGKVRAGTDLIMSAASSPRLWNLLREIQEKALTWFNVAMNYHIRLTEPEYVKLDPEEIIHNLLQLENFMLKYHSVVFGAFLPEETHCQLVSRYFSGTLSDLQKRTGADSPSSLRGNASRRPLSCSEVWDFIDSLFDLRKVLTRNGRDLQLMRDIWPVQRWKMRAEQCFIKSLIE